MASAKSANNKQIALVKLASAASSIALQNAAPPAGALTRYAGRARLQRVRLDDKRARWRAIRHVLLVARAGAML